MAFDTNDPRIIVPKRTRWRGWTLNFGRPMTWVILVVLIAACIGIAYLNNR